METTLHKSSLVGKTLHSRYQITEILCEGTLSHTYLAEDLTQDIKSKCVVKYYGYHSLHPQLFASSRRLFANETANLLKLDDHDQIPQLLDCFEQPDGLYIIQEYIEGRLLSTTIPLSSQAQNCWNQTQVLNLLYDLLTVLDFVHQQRLIHADLKPNNIIQRDGDHRFILIDFATSQPIRSLQNQQQTIQQTVKLKKGLIISPSGYLPAEQLIGQIVPNSDIYALGIVAIQALTGLEPIKLQTDVKTGELNWKNTLQNRPDIDGRLITVLDKMVRYQSQERYQSTQEVIQSLQPLFVKEVSPIQVFSELAWPGLASFSSYNSLAEKTHFDQQSSEVFPFLEEAFRNLENQSSNSVEVELELAANKNDSSENNFSLTNFPFKKTVPLVAGVGITLVFVNVGILAFGLENILNNLTLDPGSKRLMQATEAYQQGKLQEAIDLTKSIPNDSSTYQEVQTIRQQWEKDWQTADYHFQLLQQAFSQKQWLVVLQEAKQIPDISFWQKHASPLIKEARISLELQDNQLLQTAFNYALQRDFTTALQYLQQISPESQLGEKVQEKLVEYREKEQIRANYYFNQAVKHAENREFSDAIQFLYKIPSNTRIGELAKAKLIEYNQLKYIQEQVQKTTLSQSQPKKISFLFPQSYQGLNPGMFLQEISA